MLYYPNPKNKHDFVNVFRHLNENLPQEKLKSFIESLDDSFFEILKSKTNNVAGLAKLDKILPREIMIILGEKLTITKDQLITRKYDLTYLNAMSQDRRNRLLQILIKSIYDLNPPDLYPAYEKKQHKKTWKDIIAALNNEFLKSLLIDTHSIGVLLSYLPKHRRSDFVESLDNIKTLLQNAFSLMCPDKVSKKKWNNFLNYLSNEDLKNFVETRKSLWYMHRSLSRERRHCFTGEFSFLYQDGKNQSINEGIKECLSLNNVTPEIQKNVLFCILKVYKS